MAHHLLARDGAWLPRPFSTQEVASAPSRRSFHALALAQTVRFLAAGSEPADPPSLVTLDAGFTEFGKEMVDTADWLALRFMDGYAQARRDSRIRIVPRAVHRLDAMLRSLIEQAPAERRPGLAELERQMHDVPGRFSTLQMLGISPKGELLIVVYIEQAVFSQALLAIWECLVELARASVYHRALAPILAGSYREDPRATRIEAHRRALRALEAATRMRDTDRAIRDTSNPICNRLRPWLQVRFGSFGRIIPSPMQELLAVARGKVREVERER